MALMTAPQRAAARAWLIEYWSKHKGSSAALPGACQLDTTDLDSLLDAADGWRNDNAAAYNLAIPSGIRGKLNADEKSLVLTICIAAQRDFPLP